MFGRTSSCTCTSTCCWAIKEQAQRQDQIDARLDKQDEAIRNLSEENKILRVGITNRQKEPDTFAQQAATSSTPPSFGELIAASMRAGDNSSRGRFQPKAPAKAPAATERADVNMEEIPSVWRTLVTELLKQMNKTMDDECVLCTRGNLKPFKPHPTKQCGILFTLTKAGIAWAKAKRDAAKTGINSLIAAAGLMAKHCNYALRRSRRSL